MDNGAENILQELQGSLIRFEDKEFSITKEKLPIGMTKIANSGINLINQKYKKTLSHPELDESIEMEASKLADQLHDKGYSERQKGNLEKAVLYYTQALDLCPEHQTVDDCNSSVYLIEDSLMINWDYWKRQ